jgi:hypothetical protein
MSVLVFVAGLTVLAVIGIATILAMQHLMSVDYGSADRDRTAAVPPVLTGAELHVAVVLCTWTPDGIVLDGVLVGGRLDGWPVTFAVSTSDASLRTGSVGRTLERWAATEQNLAVVVEQPGHVRMSDGTTAVVFDADFGASVAPESPGTRSRPNRAGST